jgi:hypothetical protein
VGHVLIAGKPHCQSPLVLGNHPDVKLSSGFLIALKLLVEFGSHSCRIMLTVKKLPKLSGQMKFYITIV